jgi:hypothetical protein
MFVGLLRCSDVAQIIAQIIATFLRWCAMGADALRRAPVVMRKTDQASATGSR